MNSTDATPVTLMVAATACGTTPILEAARPLDGLLSEYLENRSLNVMGSSVGAHS